MSNIELEQAIVLYNIKEFKKAEIILQEIIKINKNDSNALNILGAIAAERKDYKKRTNFYTKTEPFFVALNNAYSNSLEIFFATLKNPHICIDVCEQYTTNSYVVFT